MREREEKATSVFFFPAFFPHGALFFSFRRPFFFLPSPLFFPSVAPFFSWCLKKK